MTHPEITKYPVSKKQAINNAIRICVSCGSSAIRIEGYGLYCNQCNSSFAIGGTKK